MGIPANQAAAAQSITVDDVLQKYDGRIRYINGTSAADLKPFAGKEVSLSGNYERFWFGNAFAGGLQLRFMFNNSTDGNLEARVGPDTYHSTFGREIKLPSKQ